MSVQPPAGVYLDYAATMPLRPQVEQAWLETVAQLRQTPGNPAALHGGGRRAKHLLETARERVAACLEATRAEIIFTSGATESNALGITGLWRAHPARTAGPVQVCAADHPSTANQSSVIEREGGRFEILPIGEDGRAQLADIDPHAPVVSFASVSSELGVIQPAEQIVAACGEDTLVHIDATQGIHTLPVSLPGSGATAITVAGHKIGAPVGIGVLALRRGVKIVTDRPGGDQESQRRSGTVDVAGAVAMANAMEACVAEREQLVAHAARLRTYLLENLPSEVRPTVPVDNCAPNIIHLSLPTAHPEAVLMNLDRAGVWASAGSACHAGVTRPSKVVLALGRSQRQALGVLRISTHLQTTRADLDAFLAALPAALAGAQALDGVSPVA